VRGSATENDLSDTCDTCEADVADWLCIAVLNVEGECLGSRAGKWVEELEAGSGGQARDIDLESSSSDDNTVEICQ
jgi:hypothetical protein